MYATTRSGKLIYPLRSADESDNCSHGDHACMGIYSCMEKIIMHGVINRLNIVSFSQKNTQCSVSPTKDIAWETDNPDRETPGNMFSLTNQS